MLTQHPLRRHFHSPAQQLLRVSSFPGGVAQYLPVPRFTIKPQQTSDILPGDGAVVRADHYSEGTSPFCRLPLLTLFYPARGF